MDVSLACAGQLYPAHKFVLSTCSEYFKEMFNKNPCKHPIVFMKDVSTKDMESLLDFMYKGEVHVPQSDLGSLLRTAEALQVKGLAVPDDSPRGAVQTALSTNPTDVSSLRSSHPPKLITPLTAHGKRKRPPEPIRKDDPPKLTRRPDLSFSNGNPTRSMPSSMPELKRIKKELGNNTKSTAKKKESMFAHVLNREVSGVRSPADSETQSGNNVSTRKVKIETHDVIKNGELGDAEDEGIAAEGSEEDEEDETGEEEEEEEEEEEDEERRTMSEVDDTCDNASIPNSDSSTYNQMTLGNHNSALKIKEELLEQDIKSELLQVDLSEDGTQFIIGPGGFDSSSRTSSLAGDDDRVSESGGQKKPFVCPLCGQAFTRRDNLANHIKTHTGDRPFMCQYCQKCFSRKDYLKQHERIHTGEKPYACEICGRAFTRKEGLTDHMRCHSDFKAFSCETCGKSFKQKCGLRFHKRNYKH